MTIRTDVPGALASAATPDQWREIDLDDWTRQVLRRHFDPDTGSPYWLGRRETLDFDPLSLDGYADLVRFGPFPRPDLVDGDPLDLVPLSTPRPLNGRVWESGDGERLYYGPAMLAHRAAYRTWSLTRAGFVPGRTWLHAAPSGPHVTGEDAWEISTGFGSRAFAVDMDPRWVKRLLAAGRYQDAEAYTAHVVDQIADVLGPQRVEYLNTTPAVFQALIRGHPHLVAGLDGVHLSGAPITAKTLGDFVEALDGGICLTSYHNTFGDCVSVPLPTADAALLYVPSYPQVTGAVVAKDDWSVPVAHGQIGQIRLTVLHEDLFLPNVLQRDQAIRCFLGDDWPGDGFASVFPLQPLRATPAGVY